MHKDLTQFIMAKCQRCTPLASTPVKDVMQSFHRTLDAMQRKQWARTRFTAELSKEFKIIWDRSGRWAVAGLGLLPEAVA
jgi:hypothetical protein